MRLSNVQKNAVNKIIDYYKKSERIVDFKAPTGSGKTFMASNVISEILKINSIKNIKTVVFIATLSSADLPKQMTDNINEYKPYLPFTHFIVEHKESPSSNTKNSKIKDSDYEITAENNKIIVVGKNSFGKKRIFTEQGIFEKFLAQIKNENFKLIYIRDEAHWGSWSETKSLENHFEKEIYKSADFILRLSATPKTINKKVIINEVDLMSDNLHLIKEKCSLNKGLSKINLDLIDDMDILEVACKTFKDIKSKYAQLDKKFQLNPAMLIQVSNKTDANKKEFELQIEKIIKIIKNKYNLQWTKYFGEEKLNQSSTREKISLKSLSKNNSGVDVIIFKIGPATGWNIPRACMLVQLRGINSETLHQQTIGRIKRNPFPKRKLEENDVLNNYYAYTNYQEKTRAILQYNLNRDVLKYEDPQNNFSYGKIENYRKNNDEWILEYKKSILKKLKEQINDSTIELWLKKLQKSSFLQSLNTVTMTDETNQKRDVSKQKIANILELKMAILEQFHLKNKYFPNNLANKIENEIWEMYSQKISQEYFWYNIFSDNIWQFFKEEYKNTIKEFQKNHEYKIKEYKKLPELYFNYQSSSDKKNCITLNPVDDPNFFKLFAYVETKDDSDPKKENTFAFDSENEKDFFDKLRLEIHNEYQDQIQLWSRNPVFRGINFEYFDEEENCIKNLYPDFLLRFKNKKLVFIESKSYNDIDPKKTKKIEDAYIKYASQHNLVSFLIAKNSSVKNQGSEYNFYSSNPISKPTLKEILIEIKKWSDLE